MTITLKQHWVNTSETLEARNKIGSRERKREREEVGVNFMANKQVEIQVQRNTGKQLDNGLDCAAVVKWSGKPSGLTGGSSQARQTERNKKRT